MVGRRESRGWQSTAIATALCVFGMSMDLAIGRSIAGIPWWPNVMAIGLAGAILTALLLGVRQPRFVASALLAPPALWSGVASVALFAGGATLQFFLFDPALRAQFSPGEPLVVIT